MASPSPTVGWHARGLLFENCSCQLVCPGHMHFSQPCTQERCLEQCMPHGDKLSAVVGVGLMAWGAALLVAR